MKIFTSFLLIFLVVNSVISFTNGMNYYMDEYEENGSGEEIRESSTTSTTSTTTTPTTTIAPVPQISYEVEELIEKVTTRFNELKTRFLKNQKSIYEKVQKDLENYKTLRDTSIKIIRDAYDHEIAESNNNLKTIEAKKSNIEKSIEKVHDHSWNEEENARKLENYKERKNLLTSMKAGNCDDCDGFLDDEQIEIELQKADNEIAELEEKIQKQANQTEIRRTRLNDEETRQLNTKYIELIYVYQKEVEELKKRNKLELINSIIHDKWKNYAEKIGSLPANVEEKMEKLTRSSIKLSKLTSNESSINDDADWDGFNTDPGSYEWIEFDKYTDIPSNAVLGGEDTDGSKLYIIREKKGDYYLYGKFAKSYSRKDAYVTNSDAEVSPSSFELLTFKNYVWCDTKTYKIQENTPSVCTTTHSYETSWSYTRKEIILPGTLLKDGKCRVGFGWKIHTYTDNVKVLASGSCKNTASTSDLKFWF